MEKINDILSYVVMGGIVLGTIIPLIALLRDSNKENKRLDEVRNTKKPETPPYKKNLVLAR